MPARWVSDWLVNRRPKPNQLLVFYFPFNYFFTPLSARLIDMSANRGALKQPPLRLQDGKSILYSRCKKMFSQLGLDTSVSLSLKLWHVPRGVLLTARKNKLPWLHRLFSLLFCAGGTRIRGVLFGDWQEWGPLGPISVDFILHASLSSFFLPLFGPLILITLV
jgi:hypothetical protein